MMKKILRTILRAIPVVLVLVFCLSVTAMAYSGSESVTLKTTQNEATSGGQPLVPSRKSFRYQ